MQLQKTKRRIGLMAIVAAIFAGCNDADSADDSDVDCPPGAHCPIEGTIDEIFVPEPYGLSMSWFDYHQQDHTVVPVSGVYRIDIDGESTVLQIESYYDDRGNSGHFTLRGHHAGATKSVRFSENIKSGPVCFSLSDWETVACEHGEYDLLFRVERRVVATAGFAVVNPAIYTGYHFSDAAGAAPIEVWHGEFASVEEAAGEVDNASAWVRLEDAQTHLEDALLYPMVQALGAGESSVALLQATSAMMLVGWSFQQTAESNQLTFSANCVALKTRPRSQALPLGVDARQKTFEFAPDTVTLLSFCGDEGPHIVESSGEPYRGLWPEATTFDLMVDTFADPPQLRIAPGHFLWSTGQNVIDDTIKIPSGLWESDFAKFQ